MKNSLANKSDTTWNFIDRGIWTLIEANSGIIGACLPVSFKRGPQELRKLLRKYDPAMVLCVGLAASRSHLSLERVAVNLADARIADNDGEQPLDAPIVKHAPAAYFSSVPVKAMVSRLRGRGFKAEVSYSAGTYVCNAIGSPWL